MICITDRSFRMLNIMNYEYNNTAIEFSIDCWTYISNICTNVRREFHGNFQHSAEKKKLERRFRYKNVIARIACVSRRGGGDQPPPTLKGGHSVCVGAAVAVAELPDSPMMDRAVGLLLRTEIHSIRMWSYSMLYNLLSPLHLTTPPPHHIKRYPCIVHTYVICRAAKTRK